MLPNLLYVKPKMIYLMIFASMLLFVHYSYADAVEVMRLYANTVIPVKESNIKMLKEVVYITAAPNMDNKVEADFTFKNTSDKDINLEMGFPFKKIYSGDIAGVYAVGCNKFSTQINKKLVVVKKKKVNKQLNLKIGSEYDYMFTWHTLFKAKEKKVIKCEYSCMRTLSTSEREKGQSDIQVHYITKTGALWEGSIGEADFYVKINPDIVNAIKKAPNKYPSYVYIPLHIRGFQQSAEMRIGINITPTNYIIRGNRIEWHFKNWKPKRDIFISIKE